LIDPKQLIEALSVEELCNTAEAYFSAIVDPTPQMAKPFSSLLEGPLLLQHLGLLLSGLHLGKTMTVLDFGAGSCWFSRFLNQLQCQTISCDPSQTALSLGKRLFQEHPIIGAPIAEPQFLHFDGHQIELPDSSVDRIVCVSAFHHVPNQAEVIAEFGRVLKEGGIVGFSEPGRFHSQNPQSQMEMRHAKVLENDILIEEIFELAKESGFTAVSCKALANLDLSLGQYQNLVKRRWNPLLDTRLKHHLRHSVTENSIFFLYKGELVRDSRHHVGLAHSIQAQRAPRQLATGEEMTLALTIKNIGEARWLVDNIAGIGVVTIGTHLFDQDGQLLALDFTRHPFEQAVLPGDVAEREITLTFPEPGGYRLAIDLVAEGICWFETVGSTPVEFNITIV